MPAHNAGGRELRPRRFPGVLLEDDEVSGAEATLRLLDHVDLLAIQFNCAIFHRRPIAASSRA